ncbi:hypothetical protein F5884DRAFT_836280 [Xylogone sp. PMI_703]|nr:hypothetical protein F5884DRAFT_836280 [Xylogone sp. PMI_703]
MEYTTEAFSHPPTACKLSAAISSKSIPTIFFHFPGTCGVKYWVFTGIICTLPFGNYGIVDCESSSKL